MTAILAYANGDNAWMIGDSAAVNAGWGKYESDEPKVFRKGEMLIGGAGSKRVNQVLRAAFTPPEHPPELDSHAYLITICLTALRQCLEDHKSPMKPDDGGQAILIGYRGELYYLTDDYACSKIYSRRFAVGNGGDLALGAFSALQRVQADVSVEVLMRRSMEVASEHNLTVRGPFHIIGSTEERYTLAMAYLKMEKL